MRRLPPVLAALLAAVALLALPAGAPAAGKAPSALRVLAPGTYAFARDRATLVGRRWKVSGIVRTGGGGRVIVRAFRGKRSVLVRRPAVGADGRFELSLRSKRTGQLTVDVVRPAPAGGQASRVRLRVWVLDPGARSGASMRFLKERLNRMGYWPGGGEGYDLRTRWTIMAYRKVNRMARNFALTRGIFERVARGAGRYRARFGRTGRNRVEANLSRQVYVLINARGRVIRTVPMSSGKPSTPSDLGRFRFYLKQPGVNRKGMVNSTYYNGGEAIHGYPEVPVYPASGGCLRTPTTYSRAVMDWIRFGDRIDVYR